MTIKQDFKRGRADGRAWADSGHSIADVQAVARYFFHDATEADKAEAAKRTAAENACIGYTLDGGKIRMEIDDEAEWLETILFDKMIDQLSDDEGFRAKEDESADYINGWYRGVVDVYEKDETLQFGEAAA